MQLFSDISNLNAAAFLPLQIKIFLIIDDKRRENLYFLGGKHKTTLYISARIITKMKTLEW